MNELPNNVPEKKKCRSFPVVTKAKNAVFNVFKNSFDLVKSFSRLSYQNFKHLRDPNYHATTTPLDRQLSKSLDKSQLSLLKMPLEAFIGRTLVGEKLTGKDRILYILIAATNWFAYLGRMIAAKEQNGELGMYASISYGVSRGLYTIQRTPNLIRDMKIHAKEKGHEKFLQILTLLEQVGKKIGFEKLQKLQERIAKKIQGFKKEEE